MHSSTLLPALAAILLAGPASAHMIMKTPIPFSVDKLDNGPLMNMAQFPCKSQLGFAVSTQNTMNVGQEQTLSFTGSAVHGGGSCQLSITTDAIPTANSKFKVIKSIEGGCPGVDGAPSEFKFTLPKEIPKGDVTFAWTWFASQSGGPEMYMNCAPVTVPDGADDTAGFEALPDMFIANLKDGDTPPKCITPQPGVAKFPNPGAVLESVGSIDPKPPTGDCAAAAGAPPPGGASAPLPGASTPPGGNNGQPTPNIPVPPANTGVVLAPGASSGSPAGPTATLTTLVTVTGSAPVQTSVALPANPSAPPTIPTGTPVAPANPPATPSSPPATPSSPPTAPPANGGGAGACTDGAVVCNGPTQFGLCNHGNVVFQPVAAGTTCTNGVISRKKRSFSRAHKRHFHGLEHRY